MRITPTPARRNVVLDIETVSTDPSDLTVALSALTGRTVCVGLLPDYSKVGMLAPVLLVALRVVQGIAVGGEWGGAVLMAGEHAPQGRRTFFASFAQLGSPAGLILSLIAFRAGRR